MMGATEVRTGGGLGATVVRVKGVKEVGVTRVEEVGLEVTSLVYLVALWALASLLSMFQIVSALVLFGWSDWVELAYGMRVGDLEVWDGVIERKWVLVRAWAVVGVLSWVVAVVLLSAVVRLPSHIGETRTKTQRGLRMRLSAGCISVALVSVPLVGSLFAWQVFRTGVVWIERRRGRELVSWWLYLREMVLVVAVAVLNWWCDPGGCAAVFVSSTIAFLGIVLWQIGRGVDGVIDQRKRSTAEFFRAQSTLRMLTAVQASGPGMLQSAAEAVLPIDYSCVPLDKLAVIFNVPRSGQSRIDFRKHAMVGDAVLRTACVSRAVQMVDDVGAVTEAVGALVTSKALSLYVRSRGKVLSTVGIDLGDASDHSIADMVEALIGVAFCHRQGDVDFETFAQEVVQVLVSGMDESAMVLWQRK